MNDKENKNNQEITQEDLDKFLVMFREEIEKLGAKIDGLCAKIDGLCTEIELDNTSLERKIERFGNRVRNELEMQTPLPLLVSPYVRYYGADPRSLGTWQLSQH